MSKKEMNYRKNLQDNIDTVLEIQAIADKCSDAVCSIDVTGRITVSVSAMEDFEVFYDIEVEDDGDITIYGLTIEQQMFEDRDEALAYLATSIRLTDEEGKFLNR